MPKVKVSLSSQLNNYVSEFGPEVFSTDGKILYCKICDIKCGSAKRFNVTQHLTTGKHLKLVAQREKNINIKKAQQHFLTDTKKSCFNKYLCSAMLSANIPLNKLNNESFKSFLVKYTGKIIPAVTTLRKGYVDEIYDETLIKIRNAVIDKKIWVSIDETTDSLGRFVANVIIFTLETDTPGQTFLLNSEVLPKVNNSTIAKLFDDSMHILWPEGVLHNDVLLYLSDAAPYMVKSGNAIKIFYPKVIHVTCIVHGLHRIVEKIRGHYSKVDKIISNVKNFFLKAPSRVIIFKSTAPDLSLPPEPIITRWGTWVKAACYYCDHHETLKSIVYSLDKEEAISIKNAQKYFFDPSLAANLVFIKSNFGFIPDVMTSLEAKNIPLSDAIKLIEDVFFKLNLVPGTVGKMIQEKMNDVLEKNKGYQTLVQISKILSGEETSMVRIPENLSLGDLAYFKYAPINSVDVERSFSIFKVLLADNRKSFQFENLKKHLIVQCNNQVEEVESSEEVSR
ncbi:uncharacterized protein LOC111040403 [Myzus persicae]|uniref:uncharacterized protein LOC111040403 n=1 Tax=Myzus persicae TaxID=13164 RepID=UPI000B935E4F|nr:uncharacterized protein LOC111040403 [Myzus persicae]